MARCVLPTRGGESLSERSTGGLQVGGGINEANAQAWLDAGAEKVRFFSRATSSKVDHGAQVIVTSYLFPNARFDLRRLQSLSESVGKDKLVVDVRCVRKSLSAFIIEMRAQLSA